MKTLSLTAAAAAALALAACGQQAGPTPAPAPQPAPAMEAAEIEPVVEEPVPAPMLSIVEIALANPDFSTLVAALQAADLVDTLSGAGPFTVFAPTNAAFDALPEGTVATLLQPENKDQLTKILTYHVVAGKVMAADVPSADAGVATPTVAGLDASVRAEADGSVKVNEATVIAADIEATNGVIHVIDTVLLPRD
jgi:uncharacterized surface protein with fasciclin (FAS1) repeats